MARGQALKGQRHLETVLRVQTAGTSSQTETKQGVNVICYSKAGARGSLNMATTLTPSTTHWVAADVLPIWLRAPLRQLLMSSLRLGPIPQHVAFIMDGNRRWARGASMKASHGHSHGFHALKGLLEFLWNIGVSQVSVYAFALDNFKRSQEEVDVLMQLAKSKLLELAAQGYAWLASLDPYDGGCAIKLI